MFPAPITPKRVSCVSTWNRLSDASSSLMVSAAFADSTPSKTSTASHATPPLLMFLSDASVRGSVGFAAEGMMKDTNTLASGEGVGVDTLPNSG